MQTEQDRLWQAAAVVLRELADQADMTAKVLDDTRTVMVNMAALMREMAEGRPDAILG